MRQQLISLGRVAIKSQQNISRSPLRISKRFSTHYVGYRELNYCGGRPHQKFTAEVLAGIMYWWIGWNLMTDWRHLIGVFIWPQRSEWSDEELGVTKE